MKAYLATSISPMASASSCTASEPSSSSCSNHQLQCPHSCSLPTCSSSWIALSRLLAASTGLRSDSSSAATARAEARSPRKKKSMHTFSFLNPSCLTSESVTIQLVKLYLCRGDLRVILWTRRCAKVSGQYLDVEVGDLGGNHIVSRYGGKSKMEEKTTISLVSYL